MCIGKEESSTGRRERGKKLEKKIKKRIKGMRKRGKEVMER